MIRHACSIYNTVSDKIKNELLAKCPGDTAEIKWERRNLEMAALGDWDKNADVIDSLIDDPCGSGQCEEAKYMINNFKFTKILVSPMRRTIQTAIKILESHS